MLRSLFKGLIYIVGILFVGSFILQTFPQTRGVWEAAQDQFSFFYNLSVEEFGIFGTIILMMAIIFMVSGKK
jgi:hypothetical protein